MPKTVDYSHYDGRFTELEERLEQELKTQAIDALADTFGAIQVKFENEGVKISSTTAHNLVSSWLKEKHE